MHPPSKPCLRKGKQALVLERWWNTFRKAQATSSLDKARMAEWAKPTYHHLSLLASRISRPVHEVAITTTEWAQAHVTKVGQDLNYSI